MFLLMEMESSVDSSIQGRGVPLSQALQTAGVCKEQGGLVVEQ